MELMRKRQIEGRCERPRDQNVPIGSYRYAVNNWPQLSVKKKIYEIKVSILMSVLAAKTFIAILW